MIKPAKHQRQNLECFNHNVFVKDHMFEVRSHHCLVSAEPKLRKTGILIVAVCTSFESRAKTVLVYWYWMPKPTTTLPPSLGITPSCSPTLLLFLHWTTSLSSWWPARSTPPSSNSAASSLGGRYTLLEGRITSAVTRSLLPPSAATMLG